MEDNIKNIMEGVREHYNYSIMFNITYKKKRGYIKKFELI